MAAWTANTESARGSLDDAPQGATLVELGPATASSAAPHAEFGIGQSSIVEVVVTATAKTSSPVVCICLDAYNADADTWENILQSSNLTDVGSVSLQANPFVPAVANKSAQRVARRKMRVRAIHENSNSITYSIRAYGVMA